MIEMLCNLPKMVKETKAQADAIKAHLNSRLSVAVVRNINKLTPVEAMLKELTYKPRALESKDVQPNSVHLLQPVAPHGVVKLLYIEHTASSGGGLLISVDGIAILPGQSVDNLTLQAINNGGIVGKEIGITSYGAAIKIAYTR